MLMRRFTKIIAMMLVCIVTISSEVYAGENNIDESEKVIRNLRRLLLIHIMMDISWNGNSMLSQFMIYCQK